MPSPRTCVYVSSGASLPTPSSHRAPPYLPREPKIGEEQTGEEEELIYPRSVIRDFPLLPFSCDIKMSATLPLLWLSLETLSAPQFSWASSGAG